MVLSTLIIGKVFDIIARPSQKANNFGSGNYSRVLLKATNIALNKNVFSAHLVRLISCSNGQSDVVGHSTSEQGLAYASCRYGT